jgi:cytoskeletal protein CcmA (bactofilin family)
VQVSGTQPLEERLDSTVVTPGISIQGSITGHGPITFGGRLEGNLTIEGDLTVAPRASLTGALTADVIAVHGNVRGDLTATTSVIVAAGAELDGSIDAKHVDIDPKAQVKARFTMPLALPRGVKAPAPKGDWGS